MSTSSRGGGGIGFFGLLTILFIGLKLSGVINWSWWLVMSPLIFSALLGMVIVASALIILWWNK